MDNAKTLEKTGKTINIPTSIDTILLIRLNDVEDEDI